MNLIPKQETGHQYDHIESIVCANAEEADKTYATACKRLFHISSWGDTGDSILKTDFCLCNCDGKEINRYPKIGDFIRINLSGPGSETGAGYDWVRIEEIIIREEQNNTAFTSIKVRPAACPLNNSNAIAHFFDDAATSNFIVSKSKNEVSAQIHGRNECPNKDTDITTDNVRNTVIAKLAAAKFSDIQWKNLCKGLIQ